MTTMKPCPRCHSTEHLLIKITKDCLNGTLSAKVACTECSIYAQHDFYPRRPACRVTRATCR